jgi:hypothetical protein
MRTMARRDSSEYTAPVGLLGLITTIPRVRGVTRRSIASMSG